MIDSLKKVLERTLVYKEVIVKCPTMLVVIDDQGMIFDCSESFAKILGYERGELQDAYLFDLLTEEDKERTLKKWRELQDNNTVLDEVYENVYVHKDGHEIKLKWPPEGDGGNFKGHRIAFCYEG